MSCFKRALTLALVAAVALAAGYGDSAGTRKPKPKFQIKYPTRAPDGSPGSNTRRALDYAAPRRP